MKIILPFFLISLFYSCTETVTGQSNLSDRLDKYMQAQSELNNFSGAVLLVRNDSIILEKAYGLADREWNVPNTADTKFRIASITKQFTAICILQLAEQKKLNLDDTLGKFIPGFKYGSKVTIQMLLNHSSGIQEYTTYAPFNQLRPDYFSKDTALTIFKSRPLDFEPGKGLSYSNTGYFLLGLIIEKVSGQKYADYVSQHILKVAGMQNSGVEESGDTILQKRARGYCKYPNGIYNSFDENYHFQMLSSGGIFSTVGDMYKFEKALAGNSLLNETSKKKMFTHEYSVAHEMQQKRDTSHQTPPFLFHYSCGVVIDTFMLHKRYWTGGSMSGFLSAISIFPDDKICVIVLTNMEENPFKFADPLSAILFGKDFIAPYKHIATKTIPNKINHYAGKWKGKGSSDDMGKEFTFEIVAKDGKLYRRLDLPENPQFKGVPDLELLPESDTKFFYSDGQDKLFEFKTNQQGKVTEAWFIKNGIKFLWNKI